MTTNPTFLLVHGSWHDGTSWSAVARHLRAAGCAALTPTLAGHSRGEDLRHVTHDDYVASVLDALDGAAEPVILVGHSFGGSVISRVAEMRPRGIELLVYYSAFVPRDGERVADSLPEPMVGFLDEAAAASADGSVALPRDLFATAFANTADDATVDAIYPRLVREPHRPIFEQVPLSNFHRLDIPSAYITCRQDLALPPGSFHPGQSSRLTAPKLVEIDADHEALYTAPRRLAWALLEAVGANGAERQRELDAA